MLISINIREFFEVLTFKALFQILLVSYKMKYFMGLFGYI